MTRRSRPTNQELEATARRANLPVARLRRYIRIGLVRPSQLDGRPPFDELEMARLRRIRRLADDLGLNSAAIEIVLRLVDQIEALQQERDARRTAQSSEARPWQ
jgi:DNA-binding transcriptional MerR regulator